MEAFDTDFCYLLNYYKWIVKIALNEKGICSGFLKVDKLNQLIYPHVRFSINFPLLPVILSLILLPS